MLKLVTKLITNNAIQLFFTAYQSNLDKNHTAFQYKSTDFIRKRVIIFPCWIE